MTPGMPITQAALTDFVKSLDDHLSRVAVEETPLEPALAFALPGTWESSPERPAKGLVLSLEDPAPLLGFMLTMLFFGAAAAAIVFQTQISQIW